MQFNSRFVAWLCCAAVGGGLLAGGGCSKNPFARKRADEESPKTPAAVPVEVAALTQGPIESVIRTPTHLEAERDVKVFARTANRVTRLLVEEGDQVALGQVLVQLDDDIQTTAAEKARGNLAKSRREFERVRSLYEQKLVSEQIFSDSQFDLRQLELACEDAERQLEYTKVVAPIAGTVTRRMVKEGDLVGVNQHLFDLVDFASIVARVYVPESQLPSLALNQVVRVEPLATPGKPQIGFIQRIAPVVESRTGTVKVTIAFRDVGPLRPGMYVTAELVTATRPDAVLIPRRALVYDRDQVFAYRLKGDRQVERVAVAVRIEDRLHVEPAGGFAAGDQIVVAGQTGLKDGAKVRLPGDPDPADKLAEKQPKPEAAPASKDGSS